MAAGELRRTAATAAGPRADVRPAPASQPRYLKFCQDYNQKSCCIPGHDMENQLQFENLIDGLGPGCKNPMMYPAIRYYYCLGCDPMQPAYTNDATSEIRVCKSFVDRIWRDNGKEYDDCGVMKSNDVRLAPPFSPPLHPHKGRRSRAEAPRSTPAHARSPTHLSR